MWQCIFSLLFFTAHENGVGEERMDGKEKEEKTWQRGIPIKHT